MINVMDIHEDIKVKNKARGYNEGKRKERVK